MVKKQSFGDKTTKNIKSEKDHIKLIRSERSSKTGALRFHSEMIQIPDGKSTNEWVKEVLSKKN